MIDTKTNILHTAIKLFNKYGVNKVTLRMIANTLNISSGNIAYHYKNKESIIEDAFKAMEEERNHILIGVQEIPSLERIYNQLIPIYNLEKKYSFLNLDALHIIRNHPEFAQLQRSHIAKKIDYIKAVIDLSVASGNMKTEQVAGEYRRLSRSIWMVMYFWLTQKELRGKKLDNLDELQTSVWELILPHFTEKGLYKYRKLLDMPAKQQPSDS